VEVFFGTGYARWGDVENLEFGVWATAVTGSGLPEFAWEVFEAFDAGEFVRTRGPSRRSSDANVLSGCLCMEPVVCPPFEEATRRFQRLLSENG
jgi:hypothetical protein